MPAFSVVVLAAIMMGQTETTTAREVNDDKAAAAVRLEYMKRSATVYWTTHRKGPFQQNDSFYILKDVP